MQLHLKDLVEFTGGQVRLASMPPLAGELTPIDRILLKASSIEPGDVFWCLGASRCDIELAFFRGAIGVVSTNRAAHPWPGRFVEGLSHQLILADGQEFAPEAPELKVLQLCAAQRADISPPTCDRSVRSRQANCRRQAA
jgi:hypothetical protein